MQVRKLSGKFHFARVSEVDCDFTCKYELDALQFL